MRANTMQTETNATSKPQAGRLFLIIATFLPWAIINNVKFILYLCFLIGLKSSECDCDFPTAANRRAAVAVSSTRNRGPQGANTITLRGL